MKEIITGGAYRLFYMFFNFGVGLLIAYLSGIEIFGIISLMIVNASVFHIISGLGTDSSIVWHGAKNKTSPDKLMTFTIVSAIFQILIFLFVSAGWLFFSGKTILTSNHSARFFWLELFYFMGLVWLEKYISVLYASQMSIECNKIILGVMGLIFLVLLPVYFGIDPLNIDPFSFFCFLPLAQALPLIIYFHRKKIVKFSFLSKIDMRSLMSFSFIVFITNTIQFLAYRIDYWIILHYQDAGQLGIYAQANRFAQLLWVVPNILAALMIPAIASPQSRLNENDFAKFTRIIIYTSLGIVAAIVLISYGLYLNFLPEEFYGGFKALLFMLPGFYFFVITILLAAWFAAQRLLWINFYGSLICLVVIFIADILLIPKFGIYGAAIGNTIGYTASTLFCVYMFLKRSPYGLKDLFFIRKNDLQRVIKLKLYSGK